jgi:DNA-binding GntR family transcriptional regulator
MADLPLVGASHQTLTEQVFEVLSDAILAGAVKQGERLNETELADRMGISRAPVREAFSELVKYGLATQIPRKGTFVATWTKEDLWEVALLRSVLEGLAARLASRSITLADTRFLEDSIAHMEAADRATDVPKLIDLDLAFHSHIWKCAKHRRLRETLEGFELQVRFFMIVTQPTDVSSYPELHTALLEAICSKDPERAERAAIQHVLETAQLALEGVSDTGLWDRVEAFAKLK